MRRSQLTISIALIMLGESQQYARLNEFLFDNFKKQEPSKQWKKVTFDDCWYN